MVSEEGGKLLLKQLVRRVVQPGAERVVGAEEPRSLRRQCRAAAALAAGGGVQQGKASAFSEFLMTVHALE